MNDIFNYNRNTQATAQIASSEFARITLGGATNLMQQFQLQYGQQIETVLVLGDSNIYWVPGRPQGIINAGNLVGANGFFEGLRDTQCGKLTPINVTLDGGRCQVSSKGSLDFDAGIIESFSLSMSAQSMQITQGVSVRVASMRAS